MDEATTTNTTETHRTPSGIFGTYLADAQREAGVSDHDVAQALGFKHEKVYALMKTGLSKVPLSRIGRLARVLKVSELELVREYGRAYFGAEALEVIERLLLRGLSDRERELVEAYRRLARDDDGGAEIEIVEAHRALVVTVNKPATS